MIKRFSVMVSMATLAMFMPGFAQGAELVYFHSESCTVCEQWNEEIGGLYDHTIEAKRLTLRRVSVHDALPADLSFVKGVVYTPTFVVVDQGREVGRMVGYITDYFFWEQVGLQIKRLDAAQASACSDVAPPKKRADC